MMRRFVLGAAIAACGTDAAESPGARPTAGSAAPIAKPAVLVGCAGAAGAPRSTRGGLGAIGSGGRGLGGLGTIGRSGSSVGGRIGGSNGRRVTIGAPSSSGDLDKEIIRRYIRRDVTKILSCYERALLARPALDGTLHTEFTIGADGKVVAGVTATGVDPEVATCVANVIAAIEFPAPKGGGVVKVRYPFAFRLADGQRAAPRPARPRRDPTSAARPQAIDQARGVGLIGLLQDERPVREWTPFASTRAAANVAAAIVAPVAGALAAAIAGKLDAIDRCFDGARGSLRAVLAVGTDGQVGAARVGGIGDRAIEGCVAAALAGTRVARPAERVEIACDFARGDQAPWRVTPDGGYGVIEVTTAELRQDGHGFAIPSDATTLPRLDLNRTYLVIAEPDVPGTALALALDWASAGAAVVVAVKASGGAPVLLGMGAAAGRGWSPGDHVELRTRGGMVEACVRGAPIPDAARILDPRAMDRVVAAAAKRCAGCTGSVAIGVESDAIAKDLVATTSAARRAGLHDLVIGDPACGE